MKINLDNLNSGLYEYLLRRTQRRIESQIFDTDSYDFAAVYAITNLTNGKVYIGEAVNLNARLMLHQAKLLGNYHDKPLLQQDFNEGHKFTVTILERCEGHVTEGVLRVKEAYWRHEYLKLGYELYNIPMGRKKKSLK